MKTYRGLEVNFCEECGKELKVTLTHSKTDVFARCPEWSLLNMAHGNHYLGENLERRNFDVRTGERLS